MRNDFNWIIEHWGGFYSVDLKDSVLHSRTYRWIKISVRTKTVPTQATSVRVQKEEVGKLLISLFAFRCSVFEEGFSR